MDTSPVAGWYPQAGALRYWNGTQWTDHTAPIPTYAPEQPRKYVTTTPRHTSHLFHLVMTIITAGLWLPVWITMTILNRMGREKHVTRVR